MQWIDFPAVAEFVDRSGVVRSIHGPTILGRFEFVDRLNDLADLLAGLDGSASWEDLYRRGGRLRRLIDRCLELWGISPEWLAPSQIEQLLFCRGEEPGWLLTLLNPSQKGGSDDVEAKTLAESIAAIALMTGSLSEAIELAGAVPGALLVDVIAASAEVRSATSSRSHTSDEAKKEDWVKANFDKLMAQNG